MKQSWRQALTASLELQCRKTMEIRTKHIRAGFEAGLEGLKAMEIGAKQYDKEWVLFWTSKRKKKEAHKNRPSQFKIPTAAAGQISFHLQKRFNRFATMKRPKRDQNWTLQERPFLIEARFLARGFQTEWHGAMRVSTTSSGAGATSRIAVIVQTGCGFLSGGRRGATYDDKEDCYGRATVALTRAIEHTYIVSPPDMAGLIGMAQTLGVYHYGHFTLNKRDVEYHGPTSHPSDQTAALEWGLSSPFTPQDKPPLAIAMVIRAGDRRKWKRYRLVVARKEKLHLPQRVLAVLDANTMTSSEFFPCAISKVSLRICHGWI